MTENMQFSISSSLKDVIGRDLITDDFVAIFELIKNSFDAGATSIIIDFELERKETNRIVISDNGKGMGKADLEKKWLFVAYSAKSDGTEDKDKRIYSGHKGVGRFSCDRLGEYLKIETKRAQDHKVNTLTVDWSKFEGNSTKEFQSIDVTFAIAQKFSLPPSLDPGGHGTSLEIKALRNPESWDRDTLKRLRRSLMKLIDPVSTGRSIIIKCSRELEADKKASANADDKKLNAETVNGQINNTIFKTLEGKTSKIAASMDARGILTATLMDRGQLIYKTTEDASRHYPELLDAEFSLELNYLNTSAKSTFTRRMGIPALQYGSVFLIRNGFQVFPIGEDGDDYWNFMRRKQQGHSRFLGARELLGIVRISGNETKFKESSSRNQGLIQTEAARQLSKCVRLCLTKLEAYVVGVTWKDPLDAGQSDFNRMTIGSNRLRIIQLIEGLANGKKVEVVDYNPDLPSILSGKSDEFLDSIKSLRAIAKSLGDSGLVKKVGLAEARAKKLTKQKAQAERLAEKERVARVRAEKMVSSIEKEKNDIESSLKEEEKRSLFLMSTESRDKDLLEGFIHQIIIYASNAKAILTEALDDIPSLKLKTATDLEDLLSGLYKLNENTIAAARFSTTANFRLNSSMLQVDLNNFISGYITRISSAYNSRPVIECDLDNKPFVIKFNPMEFGVILENFISNSKKARSSRVKISTIVQQRQLLIYISDNGSGLDPKIIDPKRIFEKGFTRTDGSGLGLYFAKELIEKIGGSIDIDDNQPSRGLKFLIKLPRK